MKKGVKILGLLAGLGALAFWRYKKATPEEKQKVNDFINNAKDNISKFSDELKNKAEELKSQAESKYNEYRDLDHYKRHKSKQALFDHKLPEGYFKK
jgi:gas vesicle protein